MTALLEKKLTVEDFREMDFPDSDPYFYELINGELVQKQAPSPLHQEVLLQLASDLLRFVKGKNLGRVFTAPIDVFLDKYNFIQPDICFVKAERDFIIDNRDGILGTPDLIVEIISPGSVKRDRSDKKELYRQFAVREYWLVDPVNRAVEIFVMRENDWQLHQMLEMKGKATSTVLAGFELDVEMLFG